MERIIKKSEKAYANLEAVAKVLEATSANNAQYKVQNTYFDFGLDWMWTTIVRIGYRECQVLNPRDWEMVTNATTPRELITAIDSIINDEYFGDRNWTKED